MQGRDFSKVINGENLALFTVASIHRTRKSNKNSERRWKATEDSRLRSKAQTGRKTEKSTRKRQKCGEKENKRC